jgi:hypothetical protein
MLGLLLPWSLVATPSVSLLFEARSSAYRGVQWVVQRQLEDGSWSHDARLTALAIAALCESGYARSDKVRTAVSRAVAWLPKARKQPAAQTPTKWELAHTQAQAFAACEAADLPLPKPEASWRSKLLAEAVGAQRGNGCWQEKNQDSEAATIHALIALSTAGGTALRHVP